MQRCADWRALPLPPPPDPAAAGLPSAPRRRRRWALPVVLLVGAGITAGMVYAGLHPVRLMVQAQSAGLAPETWRASYVPQQPTYYDSPVPGTDVETVGEGFPYAAPLSDGRRRIALVFPEAHEADNGRTRYNHPDPHNGKLYLLSDDAEAKPCIAAFPEGMDSLAGITDDHRILGANLHLTSPDAINIMLPGRIAYNKQSAIDLTRVGVLDNPSSPERFQAIAPRPGAVTQIAISPTGDRLLWSVAFQRTPNPVVVWGARYWKYLDRYASTRDAVGVYVTGLHGENSVRLGEETAEPLRLANAESKAKLTPLPAHLRWEPNGKSIRFVYGENDYTVALAGR